MKATCNECLLCVGQAKQRSISVCLVPMAIGISLVTFFVFKTKKVTTPPLNVANYNAGTTIYLFFTKHLISCLCYTNYQQL